MVLGLFAAARGKNSTTESAGGATAVAEPPAATSSVAAAPVTSPSATTETAKKADTVAPAESAPAAKACPQCGSTEPWGISSWCPQCFYHPRFGLPPAPPLDAEVRQFQAGHTAKRESYLAMLQSIPLWTHVLWMGTAAVFVLSVWATLKLPKFGHERAVWTVIQASLGLIAACGAHVLSFFAAIPSTDKYGPFDLLFKPFDFWRFTIHKLPSSAWRLWLLSWGLTAAFLAIVMIGGIRYSFIFEAKSQKKDRWIKTSLVVPAIERSILS